MEDLGDIIQSLYAILVVGGVGALLSFLSFAGCGIFAVFNGYNAWEVYSTYKEYRSTGKAVIANVNKTYIQDERQYNGKVKRIHQADISYKVSGKVYKVTLRTITYRLNVGDKIKVYVEPERPSNVLYCDKDMLVQILVGLSLILIAVGHVAYNIFWSYMS